ncbi:MAG: hypothetical protein L0H36_02420 [bacterium]|nr:hypothetical protein [bacterium]
MKKAKSLLLSLALVVGVGMFAAPVAISVTGSTAVHADTKSSINKGLNAVGRKSGNNKKSIDSYFETIVNVVLFLVAAVSVVVIIYGGFRYIVSNGDSTKIQGAKNTILYAVVGLVVAILAFAIINFVVKSL